MSNQKGGIEEFLLFCVFFMCGLSLFIFVMGYNASGKFDKWSQACMAHGGYLSQPTKYDSQRQWYDCIVDGHYFLVPGYEQQELERPAGLPKP